MADEALYRVRVRSGEIEVEVQAPDRAYVDAKIAELLGWLGSDQTGRNSDPGDVVPEGDDISLLDHVRKIGPQGGLEHVLAIGYYLEHRAGMAGGFRRRDLVSGFEKIRYVHSNPGVPIGAGRKQGLLIEGSEPERVRLSEAAADWVRTRLHGG